MFPYHDGHLFMITPGDTHSFEIHTTTKFVDIKFNDIYIHSSVFGAENIQRLEFILQHANHQPGCILRNKVDKLLVKPMIEAIIREYINRNLYSKEIITQIINTIIIVVARNIAMFLPEQVDECSEDKSLDILQYIQANIYKYNAKIVILYCFNNSKNKDMYMVYFKLFFLKLEGLHPLYFLKNLLRWLSSVNPNSSTISQILI